MQGLSFTQRPAQAEHADVYKVHSTVVVVLKYKYMLQVSLVFVGQLMCEVHVESLRSGLAQHLLPLVEMN